MFLLPHREPTRGVAMVVEGPRTAMTMVERSMMKEEEEAQSATRDEIARTKTAQKLVVKHGGSKDGR